MPAPTIYCIDTSSLIYWLVEVYPPKILPGLVQRVEELIVVGRLRSPKVVFGEIRPGDDCHTWCKGQEAALFVDESVAVQAIVRQLMATHHNPAKPLKGINGADPFVIAMAKDGGPHWTVVCDEHPGSQENRKIPWVCAKEGVPCISFQRMILDEGWQFR